MRFLCCAVCICADVRNSGGTPKINIVESIDAQNAARDSTHLSGDANREGRRSATIYMCVQVVFVLGWTT